MKRSFSVFWLALIAAVVALASPGAAVPISWGLLGAGPAGTTVEPAFLLLFGTGLVGLARAWARTKRRQ